VIVVKLMGGLGNQMFQYAAARRLALRHGTSVAVDLSYFQHCPEGDTPRRYELGKLCVQARIATPLEAAELSGLDLTASMRLKMMGRRLLGNSLTRSFYPEAPDRFCHEVLDLPDNVYLYGYWQSVDYFADVADILRTELQVRTAPEGRNLELSAQICATESVAVHFRCGDYVSSAKTAAFHGALAENYYQRAVEELSRRVVNPHFYVFSDDPDWVRRSITFSVPTTIIDHNPPDQGHEDLRLISLCRHAIIANSSFSWWGAWLIDYPAKFVIAPRRWFTDGRAVSGLLPETWTTLE
jgi:hypothetical protein